jgi:hypothetical protein
MYRTDIDHSDGIDLEVARGTNLLISGPPMVGKRDLAIEVLSAGHRAGDGILLITTGDSTDRLVDDLDRRIASLDRDQVGVIDCTGSGKRRAIREITTHHVSSPGDLTGISIGTAKLLGQFATNDVEDVRHGLVSVSTLLQYIDLETVFKFLHVYTNRITDTGGFGVFTLDTGSHDPATVNTITGGFDAVVELRETDDGGREMWSRGLPEGSTEWRPFGESR